MNDFALWFSTGFKHIADWQAYDHILFLVVLCGVYSLKELKKILILITSFTIGHSVTLALSVFSLISVKSAWVEFLIPVTILLTAVSNLYSLNKPIQKSFTSNYIGALIFGFIHGMGFSFLLRSLLGKSESILGPLFAFNIGLEAGQIIIILAILLFFTILSLSIKMEEKSKRKIISSVVFTIALIMALKRLPALINL